MNYTIGVGTVGWGLWVSYDAGGKFRHIPRGLEPESNCRALAVDPHRPGTIWASQDRVGVFRSEDNGGVWERVGDDIDSDIWSLTVDPHDPDRIWVGTRPGIWRSTDGGDSFRPLSTSIADTCPIGVPRTTNIVVDPDDPSTVWASVEVDGLHVSRDGGQSWDRLPQLGPDPFHDDVHGLAIRTGPGDVRGQLLVTSPFGLASSADGGRSWDWQGFAPFPGISRMDTAYCRCVREPWADGTILVCVGDYVPGRVGAIEVSRDGGATWERADLPETPNSTMYWQASHPELPGVAVASSMFGQVYVTDDHAHSWRMLDREFGEIRALSLTPS
jgi:photosystem II stability/assembly factor-like uncharacterized protein